MFIKRQIILLSLILSAFNFSVSAEEINTKNFVVPINIGSTPYNHSDFSGTMQNTKTYAEAIQYCNGIFDQANLDGVDMATKIKPLAEPYQYWLACMKWFYPYTDSVSSASGYDCGAGSVSWGNNCSSSISAGKDGDSTTLSNESNTANYQGVAIFSCKNDKWTYDSGSCISEPDPCTGTQVASWPVTEPAWAVLGNTLEPNYDPKPNCKSQFTATLLSGSIVGGLDNKGLPNLPLSSPPMSATEIGGYDMIESTKNTFFRCFNGKLITQDGAACVYRPSSCAAQTYVTADGCSFNLPEIPHDNNIIVGDPLPTNSVGHVNAYCFDGKIEIKSESCSLSCLNKVSSKTWSSSDSSISEKCNHTALSQTTRTAPDTYLTLNNQNTNMTGNAVYKCVDGVFSDYSTSCDPKDCGYLGAGAYQGVDLKTGVTRTCSHPSISDSAEHGSLVVLQTTSSGFIGNVDYSCKYGVWQQGAGVDSCTQLTANNVECVGDTNMTGDYMSIPSLENPSCNLQCKQSSDGSSVSCTDSCNNVCDCRNPCGLTGETIVEHTTSSCSYQAACTGNSSSLCSFSNGKLDKIKTCQGGSWTQTSTACILP